jgi:hypothetical protein
MFPLATDKPKTCIYEALLPNLASAISRYLRRVASTQRGQFRKLKPHLSSNQNPAPIKSSLLRSVPVLGWQTSHVTPQPISILFKGIELRVLFYSTGSFEFLHKSWK